MEEDFDMEPWYHKAPPCYDFSIQHHVPPYSRCIDVS